MAPNQSDPTSIGLTSGRVIPLKNLPYSCKYSTGETLKVWFARGAIAIASEGNAPNYYTLATSPPVMNIFGGE